tara:strand:+ start:113 stop:1024 length:912 start_codon:yes stop_codon:yes gene_type:complete
MAAGLGFKTFTTGEVLTAADTNGYLMQGVLVFDDAAARDAAITAPAEGQFAYTKDTNGLWYYDGAAWVSSGATGDIEGVTAGVGITGGGTSGTVTVTNSMATAITTAGDLIKGTGSGTFDRLGVGSTGQVLTVAGGTASWATPAGGGGMTLLSTTTMSGSYVSITSISGAYKNLVISIENANISGTSGYFRIAPNGLAGVCNGMYTSGTNTLTGANNNYIYPTGLIAIQTGTTKNNSVTTIYNYSASGYNKSVFAAGNTDPTYAGQNAGFYFGSIIQNSAITSFDIGSPSGSITGTIKIYGVN